MKNEKLPIKIKDLFFINWQILVIFLVWFIFSYPYFLHGKAPFPGDNLQYAFSPWDSYVTNGPIKNPAMTDVIVQMYPWKYFTIESFKQGIIPFWNPYSFSGIPHFANYQSAVLSPFTLLFFIFPFVDAWSLLILLQPLLAGIFMYLFIKSLSVEWDGDNKNNISKTGALVSAIGFMFCGFITVWMAWGTLGYAILFLPLALFAIEKYSQTKKVWYCLLLSLTIPLSFFSGHFQTSTYFLLFVLAYTFYKFLFHAGTSLQSVPKPFRLSYKLTPTMLDMILLLLSTVFGLLIAMPQILPSIEIYAQTLRSNLFLKGEVIPWSYLPTMLAPDLYGNPVTGNAWFGHYAEWNAYIGVLPLFLSIYAIVKKKSYQILFFIFTAVFSLLLSFSTPLLDLLIILHIPVLSTSAASRIIVLLGFSLLVLAGFGFDYLIEDLKKKNKKTILMIMFTFCLIFFGLWVIVFGKLFLPIDKIAIAKQNLVLPTMLFISFALLTISFSLPKPGNIGFLSARQKLDFALNDKARSLFTAGILLLLVFDMLRFSTKWMPFVNKKDIFYQTPLTKNFHPDYSYERVLGNYGGEMSIYFHLPSLEGYDALYLKRYGEFTYFVNNGKLGESEKSFVPLSKNSPYTEKAIDLLNVRYVVHKISDDHADWTFHFWEHPDQFLLVYHDRAFEVYKNNAAFPHTFLAGKYQIEKNQTRILSTMFSKNFDLRSKVILEENPDVAQAYGTIGTAGITKYTPNNITIAADARKDGLLFLSDSYYPDWEATIDGKPTKTFRTDYTFRSVKVPAGKHVVKFFYYPKSFIWGVWLMIIGVIGVISLFFPKGKVAGF